MLAMVAAGYMAKHLGANNTPTAPAGGGGLGGLLGGLLGGQTGSSPAGGVGGLAGMLDLNNDGNMLDDVMRMAGTRLP